MGSNVAFVTNPELDVLIKWLELEADQLAKDAKEERIANAMQAQRLMLLAGRFRSALTSATPRVQSEDMQAATPVPRNVLANTKSAAPALLAVLNAGWSVRQLCEQINAGGLKISHSYLGRMLKGEAKVSAEVRRAVREITKVKI